MVVLMAMVLFSALGATCATTLAPRLRSGDTVAFVSMASPPCDEVRNLPNVTRSLTNPRARVCQTYPFSCPGGFQKTVEAGMAQYGLNVVWGKHAFDKDEYLAGNDVRQKGCPVVANCCANKRCRRIALRT